MKGIINMDITLNENLNTKQDNQVLLRMLDRGIDDMEAGRELPLEEAFEKISKLRNERRNART